jgi:hypothetical protein
MWWCISDPNGRRVMVRRLFVTLLLVGLTASAGPSRPVDPPPPPPGAAPRASIDNLGGEVTAVDRGSITVRGFRVVVHDGTWRAVSPTNHMAVETGNPLTVHLPDRAIPAKKIVRTRTLLTLDLPDGGVMLIQRQDQPARRFPVTDLLAGGGFPRDVLPQNTYRPADVRVGDEVHIRCKLVGGVDTCYAICIDRRPGGRVPPAPGEPADDPKPWHEYANACQDYEELGVPLPEKYRPSTPEEDAERERQFMEWYNARYRTAPPPREVRPKPPGP